MKMVILQSKALRVGKSILLLLLVLASCVFSYQLWIGAWSSNASKVATEVLPTPAADAPTQSQLLTPIHLVVNNRDSGRVTMDFPQQPAFRAWMNLLRKASVIGYRQQMYGATTDHKSVTFQFGYTLNYNELLQLVPSLSRYDVNLNPSQLILNEDPWTDTVSLLVPSNNITYIFSTNLAIERFTAQLNSDMQRPRWILAPKSDDAYIPDNGLTMQESVWDTKAPAQMTLVRSFFVNPLVITSLESNQKSNVWTDGSRIVWWNQPQGQLTFQDPNAATNNTSNLSSVEIAADFIRAHGGSPADAIGEAVSQVPNSNVIDSFTMRPYVAGYPIVDGSADYQVQFEVGQITQFSRPIWALATRVRQKSVHILGYRGLTTAILRLDPGWTWSHTDVRLGYATVPLKEGKVMLKPVYVISTSGYTLWMLSAVTGRPLQGVVGS